MAILDEERFIIIEAETDPPAETMIALIAPIALYSRTPGVDEAHLVRCRDPSHTGAARSLIALVGTGDMDQVVRDSSDVIRDTFHDPDGINMIVMLDTDKELWTDIRAVGIRFYDRLWEERISDAFRGAHH